MSPRIPLVQALAAVAILATQASSQCDWEKATTLTPASGYGGSPQYFGRSLSLHAERVLIGAPGIDGGLGSAYVFESSGASWTQTAELLAAAGSPADDFGRSVSLGADTAVVGAPGTASSTGAVHVFEEQGGTWSLVAELLPLDPTLGARFGKAVAVFGDAVLIGAPGKASVYVFERAGAAWSQTAVLTPTQEAEQFGESLAFDGTTAIIGAPDDGSAFVFQRTASGWQQTAELVPVVAGGDELEGDFGESVSLSGKTAVVGSPEDENEGRVFVFELSGSTWSQVDELRAPVGQADNEFGKSVAVSADMVAIGAPGEEDDIGSVHVFTRTPAGWVASAEILPELSAEDGQFGSYVGVYGGLLMANVGLDETPLFGFGTYAGAIFSYKSYGGACTSLTAEPGTLSISAGGEQELDLYAGPAWAGYEYLLLGSFTGTFPGMTVGSVVVPLNLDAYLLHTFQNPGAFPLSGSAGLLDGDGSAAASFHLPAGAPAALNGLTLHHAFALMDPAYPLVPYFASNPVALALTP